MTDSDRNGTRELGRQGIAATRAALPAYLDITWIRDGRRERLATGLRSHVIRERVET
jgi:hypothetical protein